MYSIIVIEIIVSNNFLILLTSNEPNMGLFANFLSILPNNAIKLNLLAHLTTKTGLKFLLG